MRKKSTSSSIHRLLRSPLGVGACVGGALLAAGPSVFAEDPARFEKLEKENLDLRKRLESLEGVARKEGILPGGAEASGSVKAMSSVSVSGFVQASYFYNTDAPTDRFSDGYLWNTRNNSFSINKVKLTLASPAVERSGEKWDAGYRASLIWGEDGINLNTGSGTAGFDALREAYVELNVPVGTGLNVKAGQLISLLNYESGDGGAANDNFSQGFQWWYTGNGPAGGVQLGYTLTDWLDVKVRVQNGLYSGPTDKNGSKLVMGSLGIKPDDKTWINLLGFIGGGTEPSGASVLAGRQLSAEAHFGFEFDYFNFQPSDTVTWSVGGWLGYDFSPQVGIALRAEYLRDQDGGGLNFGVAKGPSTIDKSEGGSKGNISSLAVTLDYKPAPNVKIQPEIRYDRTSYKTGFDGEKNRLIIGAGVSYMF